MIVLQTMAVAFAMFSALPVPQFDLELQKHAVRPLCVPSHRGGASGRCGASAGRCRCPI